jgi:hypothetical protein
MDTYTSNVLAVMIVLLGLIGFAALDGMGAGISLLAAGLLLVVLGLFGWQDRRRRPAAAMASAGEAGTATLEAEEADTDSGGDEDREGSATPQASEPEAVEDGAPAPHPVVAETDAEAEPKGERRGEPKPPGSSGGSGSAASVVLEGEEGRDHRHDHPIISHGDLAAHVRDFHEGTAYDGSTIQLRLLHERDHRGQA